MNTGTLRRAVAWMGMGDLRCFPSGGIAHLTQAQDAWREAAKGSERARIIASLTDACASGAHACAHSMRDSERGRVIAALAATALGATHGSAACGGGGVVVACWCWCWCWCRCCWCCCCLCGGLRAAGCWL